MGKPKQLGALFSAGHNTRLLLCQIASRSRAYRMSRERIRKDGCVADPQVVYAIYFQFGIDYSAVFLGS
jgi:hypothetical protein